MRNKRFYRGKKQKQHWILQFWWVLRSFFFFFRYCSLTEMSCAFWFGSWWLLHSCSQNCWLRSLGVSYPLRIAESKEVSVCSEEKNLQFSLFSLFIPDFGYSGFLFFFLFSLTRSLSVLLIPSKTQTFGSGLYNVFLFC